MSKKGFLKELKDIGEQAFAEVTALLTQAKSLGLRTSPSTKRKHEVLKSVQQPVRKKTKAMDDDDMDNEEVVDIENAYVEKDDEGDGEDEDEDEDEDVDIETKNDKPKEKLKRRRKHR